MHLETDIKLRAERELKDKIWRLAASKRRRPSDFIREHLWEVVEAAEKNGQLPPENPQQQLQLLSGGEK